MAKKELKDEGFSKPFERFTVRAEQIILPVITYYKEKGNRTDRRFKALLVAVRDVFLVLGGEVPVFKNDDIKSRQAFYEKPEKSNKEKDLFLESFPKLLIEVKPFVLKEGISKEKKTIEILEIFLENFLLNKKVNYEQEIKSFQEVIQGKKHYEVYA